LTASATESSTARLCVSDDNTIKVEGVLNFETVPALAKEAERLFKKMDMPKSAIAIARGLRCCWKWRVA